MIFLADLFKEDRQNLELTQADLSELSGVSVGTIKNIEASRRAKTMTYEDKTIVLLCNALGADPQKYFKRASKVISIQCHKGGCAKTTSTINIAYSLHKLNYKVLVIDTDAQLNLTMGLGAKINGDKNFYQAFSTGESLHNHIQKTAYDGIDIITNHTACAQLDMDIFIMKKREERMTTILKEIRERGEYDYILIDCAPAINELNKSILYATDELIIPVEPSEFGVAGLKDLNSFYTEIKAETPSLNLIGLLITQYDVRESVQQMMVERALKQFGDDGTLLATRIPRDTNVKKSQAVKCPVGELFPRSRATVAHMTLTKEILNIMESREANE